jgi:ABC-type nickel/cobalt efflux system permease component RcnA
MKQLKWLVWGCLGFLITLLLSSIFATRTLAHVNDLSVADIEVSAEKAVVQFTLPIDFIRFADDNQDGKIETEEVIANKTQLETFLRDRVQLSNQNNTLGRLKIEPNPELIIPPSSQITDTTHTTLTLNYSWQQPLETLNLKYNLFPTSLGMGLPSLPTAHCLATIRWQNNIKTHIFNATNKQLALALNFQNKTLPLPFLEDAQGGWIAIFGALIWGGFHALSPGHGKTMISAYLVGTKATFKQAVALGLTTTMTHTIGVFVFGVMAWFASQYILPEQLSPWLSLISGVIIAIIGLRLIRQRLQQRNHHHHHHHHHEDTVASWRDIFALGISGGLVPCPAALVLLLSTIALGQIAYGLMLVLVFSVGLAVALIALGVLFIYGKQQFQKFPVAQIGLQKLPIFGAIAITIVGIVITGNAVYTLI